MFHPGPLQISKKRRALDDLTISRYRQFHRELEEMYFFKSVWSQGVLYLVTQKINLKRFIYNKSMPRSVFKNNAYFFSYIN